MVRMMDVLNTHNSMEVSYRCSRYDGHVVLFRPIEEQPWTTSLPDDTLWSKQVKGLQIVEVKGGHSSMVTMPEVQSLASRIELVLNQVEGFEPHKVKASSGDRGETSEEDLTNKSVDDGVASGPEESLEEGVGVVDDGEGMLFTETLYGVVSITATVTDTNHYVEEQAHSVRTRCAHGSCKF